MELRLTSIGGLWIASLRQTILTLQPLGMRNEDIPILYLLMMTPQDLHESRAWSMYYCAERTGLYKVSPLPAFVSSHPEVMTVLTYTIESIPSSAPKQ